MIQWAAEGEIATDIICIGGKQGKHIEVHNNYIPVRSPITVPKEKLQELFNKYRGTGNKEGNQEVVNFEEVIGKAKNPFTGKMENTTWGTIHYNSDGGWHIVPHWEE